MIPPTTRRPLYERYAPAIVLLGVLTFLAGCQGSTSASDSGKYEQTWTTPYSATSCADWNTRMDGHQKWVAAADMLTGARNKGDGGEGLPPDSLVDEFQAGMDNACAVDSMAITEASAGLYLTERERFRP